MPTTVGAVIVATTSAGVLTTASAKPASVAAAETAAIIALAKARPSAPPEVMLASCEEMAEHDVPQLMT